MDDDIDYDEYAEDLVPTNLDNVNDAEGDVPGHDTQEPRHAPWPDAENWGSYGAHEVVDPYSNYTTSMERQYYDAQFSSGLDSQANVSHYSDYGVGARRNASRSLDYVICDTSANVVDHMVFDTDLLADGGEMSGHNQDWPLQYESEALGQDPDDLVAEIDRLAEEWPELPNGPLEPTHEPHYDLQPSLPQPYYSAINQRAPMPCRTTLTQTPRVWNSHEFTPGRVIVINWSEPLGARYGTMAGSSVMSQGGSFQKNRRFIVLSTGRGHSSCLPISTYGGRGCSKPGTHNEDHGIIYCQGGTPRLLDGEGTLGVDPVAMVPNNESEQLHVASRVNYAKLYTVEHNFPVAFIGTIEESDFVLIKEAVDRIRMEEFVRSEASTNWQ